MKRPLAIGLALTALAVGVTSAAASPVHGHGHVASIAPDAAATVGCGAFGVSGDTGPQAFYRSRALRTSCITGKRLMRDLWAGKGRLSVNDPRITVLRGWKCDVGTGLAACWKLRPHRYMYAWYR
jgi:hypothetical protein